MNRKTPRVLVMLLTCIAIIAMSGYPVMAGASARYALPILSLSESVSSVPELEVALVDAKTPTPSYELKDLLVVDGDYYQLQAGKAGKKSEMIHDNILAAAKAGVPVVFVGPGYEKLYADLGVRPQTVEVREGDKFVEMPCAIHAVKVLSNSSGSGRPIVAQYSGAGDYTKLNKNSFSCTIEWFNNTNSASVPEPIPATPAELEKLGLGQMASVGGSASWEPVGCGIWSSEDDYKPKGRFNVYRNYYQLMNDNSSNYAWFLVETRIQTVPGYVAYGNGYRTSHHYANIPVDQILSMQKLIDYGPTTTVGSTHVNYSVGVTAGQSGASVNASMSLGYSVSDVEVMDYSDFYHDRAKWGHNINERRSAGRGSYLAKPSYVFRTSNSMPGLIYGYYQVCFARYTWWRWQQWWAPQVRLGDYMPNEFH